MRCNDCNKFVGYEEGEPEVESVDLEETTVRSTVRIVNNCAECSGELSEATMEMELEVAEQLEAHQCKSGKAEFDVEEAGSSRTSRSGYYKKGQWVAAGGRYAKTFYGAEVEVQIKCVTCNEDVATVSLQDDVQASSMEPLN